MQGQIERKISCSIVVVKCNLESLDKQEIEHGIDSAANGRLNFKNKMSKYDYRNELNNREGHRSNEQSIIRTFRCRSSSKMSVFHSEDDAGKDVREESSRDGKEKGNLSQRRWN